MANKVSIKQTSADGAKFAARVTVVEVLPSGHELSRETFRAATNAKGEGLWIDGAQQWGTSQFGGSQNYRTFAAALRRVFSKER